MPNDIAAFQLSLKALAELKEIVIEEFGPGDTDQEIEEMGLRLLRLFSLVSVDSPKTEKPKLSVVEAKALTYVGDCIKQHKQPTVRGVAEAIGKKSSRSGMRMVDELIKRGIVTRDEEGRINLTDQDSSAVS
jgi:hypothetical protein